MSETASVPASSPAAANAPPLSASELPMRAVDMVDNVVGKVNDSVIRPLVIGARALVFGLLVATMGTLTVLLVAIAAVRFLDVYLFGFRVWAADAAVGGVLCLVGLFLWSKRSRGGAGAAGRS